MVAIFDNQQNPLKQTLKKLLNAPNIGNSIHKNKG